MLHHHRQNPLFEHYDELLDILRITKQSLNRVLKEPQTRLTMCTLEYGTFDRESGQKAFRADHWLHKYGDPLGKEAEPVRKAMRRQFYPETDDWKEAVLFRGHQVVGQAIAGLQRGSL